MEFIKSRDGWKYGGALDDIMAFLKSELSRAGGERAPAHPCPVCEQPCDCRFPGAEGEDCECKNYHELEERAEQAEELLADEREAAREQYAELESLRRQLVAIESARQPFSDVIAERDAAARDLLSVRDELADAKVKLEAIEAAWANECQPNVLDCLSREQRERFRHLEGTPDETKLCYLYRGMVRVMGKPKEGDDHDCDEMGCVSVGDHVLMRFMLPSKEQAAELAELREFEKAVRSAYDNTKTPSKFDVAIFDALADLDRKRGGR